MTENTEETKTAEAKPAVKAKTAAYMVTMPNTLDHKVGDEIQLTEKQAKTLVNKVRLKDSGGSSESKAGRKSRLETEHKELTARVTDLEAQNKALHDENVKLKAPPQ